MTAFSSSLLSFDLPLTQNIWSIFVNGIEFLKCFFKVPKWLFCAEYTKFLKTLSLFNHSSILEGFPLANHFPYPLGDIIAFTQKQILYQCNCPQQSIQCCSWESCGLQRFVRESQVLRN